MKGYKKILAGVLATSMVMGSSVVVLADEGRTKGTGEMEGSVVQEFFSVVLPTVADNDDTFNYVMDPLQLIQETTNKKYDGYEFTTGQRVYFYNGVNAASKKMQYSNTSKKLKVENKSSSSVDLTVTLKVSNVDGITLTGDDTFGGSTPTTEPEMYFALEDGATPANTYAIDSNGIATHTETLTALTATDGTNSPIDAHIIQWNPIRNSYEFVINPDPDAQFTAPSYEFGITADCNLGGDDKWLKILEAGESPELEIIWGIQNPFEATITLSRNLTDNDKTDLTISNLTDEKNYKTITIDNGAGAYEVKGNSVSWEETNWNATNGGTLVAVLDKSSWTDWMSGKLVTITLTLTDGSVKTVTMQAP